MVAHHTIRSIGYHGDTQEVVDQILPILEVLLSTITRIHQVYRYTHDEQSYVLTEF